MARYIDAAALIEKLQLQDCNACNNYNGMRCKSCDIDVVFDFLEDAPTADVVEVVRCKDCKNYKPQIKSAQWNNKKRYCCRGATVKVNDDDFCSYGERKVE